MATMLTGVVVSCAAPDEDPLEQGLGVYAEPIPAALVAGVAAEEDEAEVFWGEMGEGQMHGLGRVEAPAATYVGFWERGLHHGPGLLLDHEEKMRMEGTFALGVLTEGMSTSPTVDREGRRTADGHLVGRGLKVLRDAQQEPPQWCKVLQGTFHDDHLHGRGSMWLLHAAASSSSSSSSALAPQQSPSQSSPSPPFELEQRLEAVFEDGHPSFGRALFSDGRVYIGGLDKRERRKGLGLTVTRAGLDKAVVARREGDHQIGAGLVLDFAAHTYRRTLLHGGGAGAAGAHNGEEIAADPAAVAAASATVAPLPSFWNEEAVLALLEQALADPVAAWGTLMVLTKALRQEQARAFSETPPRVAMAPYVRTLTAASSCPFLETLYLGEKDEAGRRHGQGVGILPNGDIFKGTWVQGAPEGKGVWVSLAHRDVFEGEVDRGGVRWKAGRWCLLNGWRVEASKFLRPRVPQDFVTAYAPLASSSSSSGDPHQQWQHHGEEAPQRTVIEAFYRLKGEGATKRDDADVRITSGPADGRNIFRGQVYPHTTPEGPLLELPRPRMGLEYRGQEHGSMYELVYDEEGKMISNRIAIMRQADGTTEYGGDFYVIMHNVPMAYHKNHVKQQSVRAEKEWPPKLLQPFEVAYVGTQVPGEDVSPTFSGKAPQPQAPQPQASALAAATKQPVPPPPTPTPTVVAPSPPRPPAPAPPLPPPTPYQVQQQVLPSMRGSNHYNGPVTPKIAAPTTPKVAVPTTPNAAAVAPAPTTPKASFLPGLVRATAEANERIAAEQQEAVSRALVKEQQLVQQEATKQKWNADGERQRRKSSMSLTAAAGSASPLAFQLLQAGNKGGGGGGGDKPVAEEKMEEDVDKSAGDLMDHPLLRPRVKEFPPLIIPEMTLERDRAPTRTPTSFDYYWPQLGVPAVEEEFQMVAGKGKNKEKAAAKGLDGGKQAQAGGATAWATAAATEAHPQQQQQHHHHHKKGAADRDREAGTGPPQGLGPVEVLCVVEAGWQAAHVRILMKTDESDVKVLQYKVHVHRTERPQPGCKDYKTVESTRCELPVLGLTNHIKYNFNPSIRVQYKNYIWRVQGDVVRTSPPGPVKDKPEDPAHQPFLRRMNEKGELLPNDDNGYWQWARYVSGYELSPDLSPTKSYALKARVHQADGVLALELDLAKELQSHHAEALLVWVHPANEPGLLMQTGQRIVHPFSHEEPFVAMVHGLTNGKLYNVAFRLKLRNGAYPSGSTVIILPGRPSDAGGGKQLVPQQQQQQQAVVAAAPQSPRAPLHEQQQQPPRHSEEWPSLAGAAAGTPKAAIAPTATVVNKPLQELPYRTAVTTPKPLLPPPGLEREDDRIVLTPLPHLVLAPVGDHCPSPLLSDVPDTRSEHEEKGSRGGATPKTPSLFTRAAAAESPLGFSLLDEKPETPVASLLVQAPEQQHEVPPTPPPLPQQQPPPQQQSDEADDLLSMLADVDSLFKLENMNALDDMTAALSFGGHEEQEEEMVEKVDDQHILLFKRQAVADPEFRGALPRAAVGRQPGQPQFFGLAPTTRTPFSAESLIGSSFQSKLSEGLSPARSFWALPSLLSTKEAGAKATAGGGLGLGGENSFTTGSSSSSASSSADSSPERRKATSLEDLSLVPPLPPPAVPRYPGSPTKVTTTTGFSLLAPPFRAGTNQRSPPSSVSGTSLSTSSATVSPVRPSPTLGASPVRAAPAPPRHHQHYNQGFVFAQPLYTSPPPPPPAPAPGGYPRGGPSVIYVAAYPTPPHPHAHPHYAHHHGGHAPVPRPPPHYQQVHPHHHIHQAPHGHGYPPHHHGYHR